MISEHSRVVLTKDLPERGLEQGDVGTAVHVYSNADAFEIEFVSLSGRTLCVETVPADAVRAVRETELSKAREFVTAA
ncbi:MAG: hypothetical protein ACI8UO_000942 [Verrucomicrobiales bacterium]|jgi:hypothetical protein